MTADASSSRERTDRKQIGAFFTPLGIAAELIRSFGIHKAWAGGKSVLDPTAGGGNLLEALILCCRQDEIPVTEKMLCRLKGIEREEDFTRGFPLRIYKTYNLEVPGEMLSAGDFLEEPSSEYDLILGNPPWLNFTDLPEDEKEGMKFRFRQYGLVDHGTSTLLGRSRVDLAALIIQKALQDHLAPEGTGYFFIPLSLMLNEGAHNRFRQGQLEGGFFSISEIRDFGENRIFEGVSTRCGFAVFQKSAVQKEQIPYLSMTASGGWKEQKAGPAGRHGSAFRILDDAGIPERISLSSSSRPRQGINTGGRNNLFIFDNAEPAEGNHLLLENKHRSALLPSDLVFPLITTSQFKGNMTPEKYIFLPYTLQGRVLEEEELISYPSALSYLRQHEETLTLRKGTMLRSTMKKGRFWSLLGVGPYTFAPWKIVWESYGKKEFNPQMFHTAMGKPWIPNQALQAACAFDSEFEAERVLEKLKDPGINRLLKLHNMEGTCNWAQPGRVSRFMRFEENQ